VDHAALKVSTVSAIQPVWFCCCGAGPRARVGRPRHRTLSLWPADGREPKNPPPSKSLRESRVSLCVLTWVRS